MIENEMDIKDRQNKRTKARQKDVERFILNNFDLPGLKKFGFIKSSRRSKENMLKIEARIVTFFGLQNIYQYTDVGEEKYPIKIDVSLFSEN
jgi:hypothetical protein